MKEALQFVEFNDKNVLVLATHDDGLKNRAVVTLSVSQSFLDRCNVREEEDSSKIGIIEVKIYPFDSFRLVEKTSIRFNNMVCMSTVFSFSI